jgi:hypothetical protein
MKPFHRVSAVVTAFGVLSAVEARAEAPRLLVFLHLAIKQRALETMLQASLRGITVSAVGRVADLDRALEASPDALLTLPVVLESHGLRAALQGHHQGARDEAYSLVGAGVAPEPAQTASVGALDLLGRERTTAFVHKLVGGQPRVERATKVEDLMPLLQMQRVEAILLPSRLFSEIQSSSRLNLVQRELPDRVGLPGLATLGPGGPLVLSAIGKLPSDAALTMGVDEWR